MRSKKTTFIVSALIYLLALTAAPTFAQSGCEFQGLFVDGRSVMDHLVAGGSLDNTYVGLHQESPSHWPGPDTQGEIRPVFRNGGKVTFSGLDFAGGGWGVILDGVNDCLGWRMAIWHMPEDPSSRLPQGFLVDGNTVLGTHGHSGDLDPQVWDHNHVSVGYTSSENPFDFGDETIVKKVDGYWWIHPARLETEGSAPPSFQGKQNNWGFVVLALGVTLALLTIRPIRRDVIRSLVFGTKQPTKRARRFGVIWAFIVILAINAGFLIAAASGRIANVQAFIGLPMLPTVGQILGDCKVSSKFPERVFRWCNLITAHALVNGLEPNLVAAVILQESGGNEHAYSYCGAVGLMQVMPRDGLAGQGVCADPAYFADRPMVVELQNPEYNIAYGTQLLAANISRLESVREGLKAYGPRDVGYDYADRVLQIVTIYK